MTTIAGNIAIIQTKAAELDVLVAQFRAAHAVIAAAELAIRRARQNQVALAYQERLALFALDKMAYPAKAGEKTIAQLAAKAWEGVS